MPAATAFCTSSNPARPLTTRHGLGGGLAGQHPGAGDLVDGVVPPDVLAYDEQLAVGGRPGRRACTPPVRPKTGCALAQQVGQRPDHVLGRSGRPTRAGARGVVERRLDAVLAAHPARRRPGRQRGVPVARVARPAAASRVTVTTLNSCCGRQVGVGAVGHAADRVRARRAPRAPASRPRARSRGRASASSPRPARGARPARRAGSRAAPRWRAGPRGCARASAVSSRTRTRTVGRGGAAGRSRRGG